MKKTLALLLAIVLMTGLAACGNGSNAEQASTETTQESSTQQETSAADDSSAVAEEPPAPSSDQVLVIGVDGNFEEKWNPFLVENAYDHQAVDQVFTAIQYIDENNELADYGGTCTAEMQDDGGVLYTITVNEGMRFTDGTPVTIDDYIYGLYVKSDPAYTGLPGSLLGSFIEGVPEYYYDDPNYSEVIKGFEATVQEKYTTDTISYEDFLIYAKATNLDGWWNGDAAGDTGDGSTWSDYAVNEGYEDELGNIDAASADEMLGLIARIEYDNYREYYDTETWYSEDLKMSYATGNLSDGVSVSEISGVTRIDDYTCTVKYTKVDIYGDRGLTTNNGAGNLIPRHYYGDYEKGDLSKILSNMSPMGSGPYIWGGYESNIITCTANTDFFLGEPKIGTVRWQYYPQSDLLTALESGDIDICNPTGNKSNVATLDSIGYRYDMIDNAGYGYMAMNTENVPLLVRKGIWCLMNRQPSVEGYYGPVIAKVIERPMTTTLAEYPQGAESYYPVSKDEALKYFEQAGYTQKDGKLVDATGKQLTFNCYIAGEGEGDHPAFAMLVQAAEDMKDLGGEIQIQDVAFNVLQAAMNDGTADAWIMAWSAVYDCDKSTQFHSTGGQNRYNFKDSKMDNMLETIVQTIDLNERRKLVSEMLDYAMDQCLELPLYQRKNIIAYYEPNLKMETVPVATTACNYEHFLYLVEMAD